MSQNYFQKGFGMRLEVRPELQDRYRSRIVDRMREVGSRLAVGDLTFVLAREFGFCYGVDRALEYAYETVRKFPDRRIFLTGEIIHNPQVNRELQERGIRFLPEERDPAVKYGEIRPPDVVVLPAFGVPRREMETLNGIGCTVVDTTCGSVLNVWKNVERYASLGVTSIIHGKFEHQETRATFSRTTLAPGAHYLVVRNTEEAAIACDYIVDGGDGQAFLERFSRAISAGFDPDRHLERVGLANQTTMLSSESLEVAEMFRLALARRYGDEDLPERFIAFDTICSATEDRQQALLALRHEDLDAMIVIGGYNSSNTTNLARIAATFTRSFHIEDAAAILETGEIRHKLAGRAGETRTGPWLAGGPRKIGLTAGASTPNSQIGEAIERIVGFRDTMALSKLKEFVNAGS